MKIIQTVKVLCLVAVLSLPIGLMGQGSANDQAFEVQRTIYQNGLRYNDLAVSTQALHAMIAMRPNDASLKDTLARVYFERAAYPQTIIMGTEVLKSHPENEELLEVVAVSRSAIGMLKEALADYEALYFRTKKVLHLYEIATLQFGMGRYKECENTIKDVLSDPSTPDKEISLASGKNNRQTVPLKAAALNMRGVLAKEMGKADEAKAYFKDALKEFPEFELAKVNVKVMEEGPAKDGN